MFIYRYCVLVCNMVIHNNKEEDGTMKCEQCDRQACTYKGSKWTLCKEHLFQHYPHFELQEQLEWEQKRCRQ
jgi:hypothetical protein